MNRIRFFLIFAVLAAAGSAHAVGVLYSRPIWGSDTYDQVWIKTVDATVAVSGQVAVTHVDQTFMNEMNQTVEAVWIFPLPEGAVVTELYFWFNGKRYKGDIREARQARQQYEDRIRRMLDPALLEYLGNNLFRLSIAPVNPNSEVRTEITYVEMLTYEFGTVGYTFGLDAVGMSPKPLNRVSLSGTVETQNPIKFLRSPSHGASTAIQIVKVNDTKYTIVFGDENFLPDRDLRIEFETFRSDVEVNVLRYTPVPSDSIGSDSFYAVWITPPDSIAPDAAIPRKIVFTADVSSSMEGLRIEQLKEALGAFLDNLGQGDFFNIVTFGTSVMPYRPDIIPATPAAVAEAKTFVAGIGALGLTNIDEALAQSLGQSFSSDCSNMIVFITDGYPTWGETFVPDILANVREANTGSVRIFSFGVGEEVSKPLLVQVAVENGGYPTFIQADDSIAAKVQNHFTRISKPVLTDLLIEIPGLVTADKFPRPLPDLFWGSQVMQLGLYANSGTFDVKLGGAVRGQAVSFESTADFPTVAGGSRFVPWLWADAKISYLLDQIAMYGEQAEFKNQVIELSLKFNILTPYTAFYSDPNEPGQNGLAEERPAGMPSVFRLHPNYPNPFNASTAVRFDLPVSGVVVISIYDVNGRLVRVLADGSWNVGSHSVEWDGKDSTGNSVPSGIYVCRMRVRCPDGRTFVQSVKMGLVR